MNLDPASGGVITNQPITPGCLDPRRPDHFRLTCGIPVARLSPGGVYITVNVLYQPYVGLDSSQGPTRTVAGYPAQVVTGPDTGGLGCPAAARWTLAATLARRHVEPSEVWILVCLGRPASPTTRRQISTMLATARIAARPPADAPVAGAAPCTAAEVGVLLGADVGGVSQTSALSYGVKNIGSRTCSLLGYPRVQLEAGTRPLPLVYHTGGGPYSVRPAVRPHRIYLRPGAYGSFLLAQWRCDLIDPNGRGQQPIATSIEITLPGQSVSTRRRPTDRTGQPDLAACGGAHRTTVYISPLVGY